MLVGKGYVFCGIYGKRHLKTHISRSGDRGRSLRTGGKTQKARTFFSQLLEMFENTLLQGTQHAHKSVGCAFVIFSTPKRSRE